MHGRVICRSHGVSRVRCRYICRGGSGERDRDGVHDGVVVWGMEMNIGRGGKCCGVFVGVVVGLGVVQWVVCLGNNLVMQSMEWHSLSLQLFNSNATQ